MTTNNQNIELLKCEGINKWYGNLHALKDVNMSTVSYTHLTLPTKA